MPGNRVLLRGGNSIGMALAWLAVVKAGLIAVATMPLLRARELGDIIDKAQPTLAVCATAELLDELETAQREHPVLRTVLRVQRRRRPARPGQRCAARSARSSRPARPRPTTSRCWPSPPAPPASPRRRCTRHRDVLAACEAWPRHVLQRTPDDIVVGSPPLAFTFGLGGLLVFPMWAGASV